MRTNDFVFAIVTARRALKSVVTILASVYAFIVVFGFFFADRLIFQPHASSYRDAPNITKLRSGASEISAVYLPNATARYTILYSHGNAEDLGDLLPMLEN